MAESTITFQPNTSLEKKRVTGLLSPKLSAPGAGCLIKGKGMEAKGESLLKRHLTVKNAQNAAVQTQGQRG